MIQPRGRQSRLPQPNGDMQMLYAIITQDGLDQVCETKATANAEVFDLRRMGHKVEVKKFSNWQAFDKWEASHYA